MGVLRFERSGVRAWVNIGGEGASSRIDVARLNEPPLGPVAVYAGIGALVGVTISVVGGFLFLRSRRTADT